MYTNNYSGTVRAASFPTLWSRLLRYLLTPSNNKLKFLFSSFIRVSGVIVSEFAKIYQSPSSLSAGPILKISLSVPSCFGLILVFRVFSFSTKYVFNFLRVLVSSTARPTEFHAREWKLMMSQQKSLNRINWRPNFNVGDQIFLTSLAILHNAPSGNFSRIVIFSLLNVC